MFDQYRNRMKVQGGQMGQALKRQSDVIMDATFHRDIAFRKCYIQDKDVHFPEQTIEAYRKAKSVYAGKSEYDPKRMKGFKPIDAKYLVKSYYSISGDTIDYYLQFRPNVHGTNPNIRVGAYVFIPDDLGVYNLWIIVARDDKPQFPQFYVLRCDFLAKWHISHDDVVRYEGAHVDTGSYYSWAVARIQSSYNSGVWTDYLTTSVENQKKLWFPTNNDTQTIAYNEHIIISNNPLRRTSWEVTKIVDTEPVGLTKITLAQQLEYSPRDDLSWVNVTSNQLSDTQHGIDYDFFQPRTNDQAQHSSFNEQIADSNIISFSGVKPNLKCGGSYKTYTANFYNNGQPVSYTPYWRIVYFKDGTEVCAVDFTYSGNDLVVNGAFDVSQDRKVTFGDDFGIQYVYNAERPSEIKIRCLSILNMIGGKFVITANASSRQGALSASIEVEVDSL